MSRTNLYIVIGVLAAALLIAGFYVYQQQTRPGLDVHVDDQGISIQGN